MLINYTPTITGGFVFHLMRDAEVRELLDKLKLTEENEHDLVKAILIAGFRDLESDVDKSIRRKIKQAKES